MKSTVQFRFLSAMLFWGFFFALPAFSAVPPAINYQGKLTDPTGVPVADDTYSITFSIYNGSGVPLWSETQSNVLVINGIFNVMLPADPGTYPFPAGLFNEELFLGIKVGTDAEMIPRQPLTSVPFAFKAGDTDTLGGLVPDDFAAVGHEHDFADINGMVNDAQVPDTISIIHAAEADLAGFALNADNLDGQDSSSFAPAVHGHSFAAISGQAGDAQIPDDITIEYAAQAGNADTVDGQHAGAFMAAGADNWVNVTGDSMSGRLAVETIMIGSGWGESIFGELYSPDTGAGVYGLGHGPNSHGVHGGADGSSGVGVYGEAVGSSGIGVYGTGPGWAGYFYGNLHASGNVGIGIVVPQSKLHVDGDIRMPSNSNIKNASGRDVFHTGWNGVFGDYTVINSGYDWGSGEPVSVVAGSNGVFFTKGDASGTPYATTLASINTTGRLSCPVLEITGGSDIAEPFEIQEHARIKAGLVMAIDPDNPGKLRVSDRAYDRRVAGIVSGAGGVNPGMVMQQKGSPAGGETPIALTGRVYCWADATSSSIQPGDLLTTSDTPGHAMKVADHGKANGAVLGKAMTALEHGTGLVLVLVSLQ